MVSAKRNRKHGKPGLIEYSFSRFAARLSGKFTG